MSYQAVNGAMSEGDAERHDLGIRAQLLGIARPGVMGSLLLHAVMLGVLLYQIGGPPVAVLVIPVEMVELAEETAAVAQQPDRAAAAPGVNAPRRLASVPPPRAAVQPRRVEPAPVPAAPPSAEQSAPDAFPPAPVDSLQSQLEALAKLRIPNSSGASSSIPAGAQAGYRVEDLIRAQVLRRWNLRLDELGESELTITIHVVLEADGTVAKAEIVDTTNGTGSEAYRSIALSARNAVLLSSPLTLPKGMTDEMRDMTLSFNTRDTLR